MMDKGRAPYRAFYRDGLWRISYQYDGRYGRPFIIAATLKRALEMLRTKKARSAQRRLAKQYPGYYW